MANIVSGTGSCLCGNVKITAGKINTDLGVCHCSMCRRANAGPYLAVDCGTEVKIEGEEHVKCYNSSDWAERAFCTNCGSSLFYRLKATGQTIVSSELFDGLDLKFDHEIFIDEKPSYYNFSGDSKKMTGAEVFSSFSELSKD